MALRSAGGSCAAATLVFLLFVSLAGSAVRGSNDDRRPDVLSRDQVRAATGKTIAQWGAEWWQWAFDHPEVQGDTTGAFGYLGNVGGPVFFALGSFGAPVRASYNVPTGQYILLPVATYIWTFFDPCAKVACAREIVNENFIDGISYVSVRIDGEPVHDLAAHLVRVSETRPVIFKVNAGPIPQPGGYGGILDAVQGGYWLMLEPLQPGKHNISMFATVPNLDPITGEILTGSTDLDAKLELRVSRSRRR